MSFQEGSLLMTLQCRNVKETAIFSLTVYQIWKATSNVEFSLVTKGFSDLHNKLVPSYDQFSFLLSFHKGFLPTCITNSFQCLLPETQTESRQSKSVRQDSISKWHAPRIGELEPIWEELEMSTQAPFSTEVVFLEDASSQRGCCFVFCFFIKISF